MAIPFNSFTSIVFGSFTMIVFLGKNRNSNIIVSAAILNVLPGSFLYPFSYVGYIAVVTIELYYFDMSTFTQRNVI
jgi:hypothetical protein